MFREGAGGRAGRLTVGQSIRLRAVMTPERICLVAIDDLPEELRIRELLTDGLIRSQMPNFGGDLFKPRSVRRKQEMLELLPAATLFAVCSSLVTAWDNGLLSFQQETQVDLASSIVFGRAHDAAKSVASISDLFESGQ